MLQDPPVIQTFNRLPPAWDRPGMFVANLFSLFFGNENQTKDLCTEVEQLETYGGRLVPILGLMFQGGNANKVVLEQEPDRRLFEYFTHTLDLKSRCSPIAHTNASPVIPRNLVTRPISSKISADIRSSGWMDL